MTWDLYVAAIVAVSRSAVYDLCKRGQLHHVRVGDRMVVPATSLEEFITRGGEAGAA